MFMVSTLLCWVIILWFQRYSREFQQETKKQRYQSNKVTVHNCRHDSGRQQSSLCRHRCIRRIHYGSFLWKVLLVSLRITNNTAFRRILPESKSSSFAVTKPTILISRIGSSFSTPFLFSLLCSVRKHGYCHSRLSVLNRNDYGYHKVNRFNGFIRDRRRNKIASITFQILRNKTNRPRIVGTSSSASDTANDHDDQNTKRLIIPQGITLKIAVDQNGAFSEDFASLGEKKPSVRFTCSESLDMVHRLRCVSDAVLIGKNTVIIDNPSLTIRRNVQCNRCSNHHHNEQFLLPSSTFQPLRVILDPRLSLLLPKTAVENQYSTSVGTNDNNETKWNLTLPTRFSLFEDGLPTLIYHTISMGSHNIDSLSTHCYPHYNSTSYNVNDHVTLVGIHTHEFSKDSSSSHALYSSTVSAMNVEYVIDHLYHHYHVKHIMVEGGPTTAKYFLEKQLVDRCIIVKAPIRFENPYYGPNVTTTAVATKNDNGQLQTQNSNHHDIILENNKITSSQYLSNVAGLQFLGQTLSGNIDTIEYWSKPNVVWPSLLLSSSETDNMISHNRRDFLFQWP